MPSLNETITGFVVGDDLEIRRNVTDATDDAGIPAAIVKAWLTIKRHARLDDPGTLQKVITTVDDPGTGQIVEDGGPSVDADLRFDLTQANTTALGTLEWVYDIQIRDAEDSIFTVEKGTLQLTGDVTRSIS